MYKKHINMHNTYKNVEKYSMNLNYEIELNILRRNKK